MLDDFTRECLSIRVARKLRSTDVIDVPSDLFILRGVPEHIRSDNGPEFVAKAVQDWIAAVGAKTAYIEPGSPWENGYIESFNAASGMSCLTARFSTRSPKPGSSWKAGAAFTIHCALMDHWATGPQPQRSSFRSPRGRLRYPNRLRRPRWRRGRPCTNIQPGPLDGG